MDHYQWPRGLVRRMSQQFQLRRGTRTKEGGEVIWNFDSPETIYGLFRPPSSRYATADAEDFTIGESGEEVQAQYILDVLESGGRSPDAHVPEKYIVDPQIELGDRLVTDRGPYRVADTTFMHKKGFGRYALIEDARGDSSGGNGEDDDSPYEIA